MMVLGTKAKMKLLLLSMYLLSYMPPTSSQCANESPIPPTVLPTSWTAWYSMDKPSDGMDDETHAAVKSVHLSVCNSPNQAECRVRFLQTDHVTAGQTLATGCSPIGGLLCRDTDQANLAPCLDYEIRFECQTSNDALPEPHFHWDMSTKTSIDAEEPMTCTGTVTSIYPNAGGMTGTVAGGTLHVTDSFDSSDYLCAVRNQRQGWIQYGSANDKCISEPACCTSGFTITFWLRNRTPNTDPGPKFIISTGGQTSSARGTAVYFDDKLGFDVRGVIASEKWLLSVPGYSPDDQWTYYSYTYEPAVGNKYYKNGVFVQSQEVVEYGGSSANHYDDVVMFSRNINPQSYPYVPLDGDLSNFKMFYRSFNDTEVLNSYLKETSESKLLIHYLRKHSHDNSFGVQLECLAKAGSQPTIIWHRSDDGAHFNPVLSSDDVAIHESTPNSYRRRSLLILRHLSFSSTAIFACEATDVVNGGSVTKMITIPKRIMYWTPWLSADSPMDGDDRETLTKHQQDYDLLCKYPTDIQCRTVYDGIPSNESGQVLSINCTVSSGMECLGSNQSAAQANSCYDYKVRYKCPEPRYRWTPWYDAKNPDGSMEDETFATHLAQAYPDLCSQPIGAECRIKSTSQDLLASGFIPQVPYLCNANGFRCQHADNIASCPDFEVRYRCPDSTAVNLRIDDLKQQSHHLDPDLRLNCSATIGIPTSESFNLKWKWLDSSYQFVAVPISSGGIVDINPKTSSSSTSVMTIENFSNSTLANTSLVCVVQDGITIDAKTIEITPPSWCELPLGVSSGDVDVMQISPSTVKVSPFKIPGVNGLAPWVPAVHDSNPTLDFDLGVDFAITGVAIQGDPVSPVPTNLIDKFSLYHRDTAIDSWVLYADGKGKTEFLTDYAGGTVSFTSLSPNITTRFLRFQPTTWTVDVMMRVEIYGCSVGESTLRILQLDKTYDVTTNNFTFTCLAEHYPIPVITWLANYSPISPNEGIFAIFDTIGVFPTAVSTLNLIGFHPDNDSVTFTCKAQAGNKVEMSNISTEYGFVGTVSVSGDTSVYFGSNVIMTCSAFDDDIYVIAWGHRPASTSNPFSSVQSNERYVITNTENSATNWDLTLTINRFIQTDEGEYACLVNSDTARDTLVVVGSSGLREGWANATYDEKTNIYQLECAVIYPNIEPDVIWIPPNGDGVHQTNGRYQIQNSNVIVNGNLTKVSTLRVHPYNFNQDDGHYKCSATAAGQVVNITIEAQYAYQGQVSASATTPVPGLPVYFNCTADDVNHVYHADWLRVVGNDRILLENGVIHKINEDRSSDMFHLSLEIDPYSRLDDGFYVCSINNGTAETTIALSGALGHGHSHGGCSGGHDHDHDPPDRGTEFSLYTKIDTERVECLNEVTDGSGKLVFKPWDQRLDIEKYVESDDDEELLFNIPFTGNVKLKGVIVIGGNEDSHPSEMRLYKNQPNMTFDDARSEPDQVFEMQRDSSGILEYNTKIARFSNVNHLSIHFSKNFGAETTIVYYIGLRGEFTEARRQGILIAQYEAFANPKDHKTSITDNVQQQIS